MSINMFVSILCLLRVHGFRSLSRWMGTFHQTHYNRSPDNGILIAMRVLMPFFCMWEQYSSRRGTYELNLNSLKEVISGIGGM